MDYTFMFSKFLHRFRKSAHHCEVAVLQVDVLAVMLRVVRDACRELPGFGEALFKLFTRCMITYEDFRGLQGGHNLFVGKAQREQ